MSLSPSNDGLVVGAGSDGLRTRRRSCRGFWLEQVRGVVAQRPE
jgi:hypothetical protein